MSALETIVEELKMLPPGKLPAAAENIHRLKATSEAERRRALDRAYGCLTDEEAGAMEEAIQANCERTPPFGSRGRSSVDSSIP